MLEHLNTLMKNTGVYVYVYMSRRAFQVLAVLLGYHHGDFLWLLSSCVVAPVSKDCLSVDQNPIFSVYHLQGPEQDIYLICASLSSSVK